MAIPTAVVQPTAESSTSALAAGPPWIRYVAMLTGVLAAVGGFLTVRGSKLANEAIYHSTRAVLNQAEATDVWAEYQADSIKARGVETQLILLAPDAPARGLLEASAKELRDRQHPLTLRAKELEGQRGAEIAQSDRRLAEKNSLDFAGTFVQLGIALASVAAMTRRRTAFVAGIIAAGVGIGVTAYVLAIHHIVKS
ncbi:MAG: hypothetical protein JWP03_2161 [Phycisphaerales bacterium]|nr:hypothetical protein [Phycisphaerales bacterium]